MDGSDASVDGPPIDRVASVFQLRTVEEHGEELRYHGDPLVPERTLRTELRPAFREAGYELSVSRDGPETTLTATPVTQGVEGIPWTNLVLFVATVCTTLLVGAFGWYHVPAEAIRTNPLALLRAWPFTAAVLGVLATHELGHYVAGRYHGVDISLPYFIPFLVPFGTLGAVIRMRGRMPSRRVLFDIGVAGPIAGLVATFFVTVVGLSIDPMQLPAGVTTGEGPAIVFHDPPLLALIATLLGEPTSYADPRLTVHPIIVGAWVGMFFTLLNLLPVGQLDGGHMLRAMLGPRQRTVGALVPGLLFGLAGYLHLLEGYGLDDSVGLWGFWGLLALAVAYGGSATPADETPVSTGRLLVGCCVFVLGALCFLPVPIETVPA